MIESCEVPDRQEQSVSKRFPINVNHPSGFRKTLAHRADGAKLRKDNESDGIIDKNNYFVFDKIRTVWLNAIKGESGHGWVLVNI